MKRYLAAWLGSALAIAGLDFCWLTTTNATLYRPALGPVLAATPRAAPAILFYLVYICGVLIFAVTPAIRCGRWREATTLGGLFGLFCYATYDLTNQATLIVWDTRITIIDLCWGTCLTSVGSTAGYFTSKLVRRG